MFAQAPITELSVARACESLQASLSLLQTTQVDLAIGLVGTAQVRLNHSFEMEKSLAIF